MRYCLYYLKSLALPFISLFIVLAGTSYSFAFTAETYGNFSDVTVMRVEGNYDNPVHECGECRIPRQIISKEFYSTHGDQYDFLIIFSNFDFQMPESYIDGERRVAGGFLTRVSNSVHGIGEEIFDNTAEYGSHGRLKGVIDMGSLGNKATDPLDPGYTETMTILSHELLHQWAAYVRFKNNLGEISNALIGLDDNHWSYLLDTKGSVLYGNKWRNNGNGTFTSLSGCKYYGPLDLYLMGLIDKSVVPPILLIENPSVNPTKLPDTGATIEGIAKIITINDIIAVEGERVPSATNSQKSYKFATILIIRPDTFNESELYQVRSVINDWVMWFSALTDGRAKVVPDAAPAALLPENPGVAQLPYEPRDLPAEINDAVNWLKAKQEENGSWMDSIFTRHRDTIHALAALNHFPAASQNTDKGLIWLNDEHQLNADALSGKIILLASNGQNIENLKNELMNSQNPDGGWGANRNYISNPLDTSFALIALSEAHITDSKIITPALEYLKAMQYADKGWGCGKDVSDIQTTVNVLSAFAYYQGALDLTEAVQNGLGWLYAHQNANGGFANSPSTVYDTASALMFLNRINGPAETIQNALNFILTCQSKNGSWYESSDQTALAVSSIWNTTQEPDLAVETGDITFQPPSIGSLPAEVSITAIIKNKGFTDIPETTAALYKGPISTANQIGQQIISVPGKSSVTINFTDTVTEGQPQYYYIAVDTLNQVTEACETNNQAMKILNADVTYDFEILDSDVSVSPIISDMMQPVSITANIKNKGAADAYNVPVKFYVDGTEISSVAVDLPAGSTAIKQITWNVDKSGVLTVSVSADPADIFPGEVSEANNTGSASITVNPSTQPNLYVSHENLTVTPANVAQGGNATISIPVGNNGFATINNIDVRIYAGEPQNGSLIGSSVIPALGPGESKLVQIDWTNIQISGDVIIYVAVSTPDGINEISSSDNIAFTTVNVVSLPDLFVSPTSVAADPAIAREGDAIKIHVTVMNKGKQAAADVAVMVSESGNPIHTEHIDVIAGNSQKTVTFLYDTSGKKGSHQLQITIDPGNAVAESDETNNSTVCGFAVQDTGDVWLTESCISPNGDNVQDAATFFFKLDAPAFVRINIIDDKGEVVRSFSGGVFDNCLGGEVVWDGMDETGKVVPDGRYRINVIDAYGVVVAGVYILVDNNRSSFSQAIGTPYFSTKNITCHIPGIQSSINYEGWIWDLQWFSDESGLLFLVNKKNGQYPQSIYPDGLYTMSPEGEDITRLTPWEWQWEQTGTSFKYGYGDFELSKDDESVVFVLEKYAQNKYGGWDQVESQIWVVDRYGRNLRHVVTTTDPIEAVSYSPDRSRIAYLSNYTSLYFINPDGTGNIQVAQDTYISMKPGWSWCKDSSKLAYVYEYDYQYGPMYKLCVANADGNLIQYDEFKNAVEFKWLTPDKLAVVNDPSDHTTWSDPSFYDIWLFDIAQNAGSRKIAEGIYDQSYRLYEIYFKSQIYVNPKNNKTFAFIDNSAENWAVRLCDDRGNCRTLYESPKVNYDYIIDLTYPGASWCEGCYVSLNDLRWSPDGNELAFIDFAYQPLLGEILPEKVQTPCSYTAHMVVADLIAGDKKAYPLDEFFACELPPITSYHIFTIDNGSWIEQGILHYKNSFADKSIDLPLPTDNSQNAYKIRIEQRGEESADIDYLYLNVGGEEDYSPTSAVNITTGENILSKILAKDSIAADAYGQTLELTWEDIPAGATNFCRLTMRAREINYSYQNDSLNWLGGDTLIARDQKRIIIADADTGKTDLLPIEVNSNDKMTGSPLGNYITYPHYDDESNCEGFLWSLKTLLNSPAVLQTRRTGSAFVLEGTATDINFDRYVLEYANAGSPDNWNLIAPPSNTPIINGQFTTWVPPDEGAYYVRLTVYDKAGNQTTVKKQVSWDASTVISSLYKTDVFFSNSSPVFSGSGEIFSPYTDSAKNAVALHYRVEQSANLKFSIINASGNCLKTIDKSYASVPPGGIMDYIIWDGKDNNGHIAPDGVYTIKILDYEFYVQIDRTAPAVDISLSTINPNPLSPSSEMGSGNGFTVELFIKAEESNLKTWTIEYGIGANPGQWIKYTSGNGTGHIVDSGITFPITDADIAFAANKTFKLTAEDAAGNISTRTSSLLEEQLIIDQFEIPLDAWASLGNSIVSTNETPWFTLGLKRTDLSGFIPVESVPSPYLTSGSHTIKGLETIRRPIVRAFMQYCGSDMSWSNAYEIEGLFSNILEFDFNTAGINIESIYAIRIKAVDDAGNACFSNPMPISPMLKIEATPTCALQYSQLIHENLKKLHFQYTLKTIFGSTGYQWKDYKVLDAASGNVIKNGIGLSLPTPSVDNRMEYLLRVKGTGESGASYTSNTIEYPPTGCENDLFFKINLNYNYQGCDTGYSDAFITPEYGKSGPPQDFSSITYYLLNARQEVIQTIGANTDATDNFGFDIRAIPPGAYEVKAVLETRTTSKIANTSLIIDDVFPQARITYPAISEKICPIKMLDEYGKDKYIINAEGMAQDNRGINSYTLYYGLGENPIAWIQAIQEKGSVHGLLGQWDVTSLSSGIYRLKLEVKDGYGNTACDISPGFYVDRGVDWIINGVDKKLFSPNGDGVCDDVRLSYALNETAMIGVDILQDDTLIQTVMPMQSRPAGASVLVWDVFNHPDGIYDMKISGKDDCENLKQKIISGIEVDMTKPDVEITSPDDSDPPGVIVEVNGTAKDRNFLQYRLEAVSVENPDHVILIRESSQPVVNGTLGAWNNFGLSGSWQLHLTAKDKAGNSGETSVTISLGNRQSLIRDLFATHGIISPNNDGTLDRTEIHFELNPDTAGLYNVIVEIRSMNNSVKKTYALSSITGGEHSCIWNGESDISGENIVPDGAYRVVLNASLVSAPGVVHSESITVTVDSSPPGIAIHKPLENEYVKEGLDISGSVSDANLKIYHVECIGANGSIFSADGDQNRENYRFACLNEVADGAYELAFRAEDMAGNLSEKRIHFTVDKTPPEIHLISPVNKSFYGNTRSRVEIQGTIKEDSLESWTLSYGAGETPSSFVELAQGTGQPDGGINFKWPVGKNDGIADGVYTICLKAVDRAGWTNESRDGVIVDNTAPDLNVTSPADGAYVKAFEIKGSVFDANIKSYTVELSEGNCATAAKWSIVAIGKTVVENNVIASLKGLLKDNTYCFKITAMDQLDNTTALTRSITLDTKPPGPPVLSGVLRNRTERYLSWTQNPEPDIAGYNLYKNGVRINSTLITGTSYLDSVLVEGTVIYTVTAVDLTGWESASSNRIEFKVDLTPPIAKILIPRDGATVGELADIRGTAYSPDDFKEYRVFWGEGESPAQWLLIRKSPAPVSNGVLAHNNTVLANGAFYSIKLEAEDLSGNISTHVVVFHVDNLAPAAPVLISAVLNGADVTVTWQANIEPDLAGYLLYRNSQLVNAQGKVPDSFTPYLIAGTQYTDKNLPDGDFSYQLYAADTTDNLSLPSNIIFVHIDRHAPHMSIVAPANGFQFDGVVLIEAQTPDIDISQVRFQYKNVATLDWSDVGDILTNTPWKKYFDPKSLGLPYGQYNIRAKATDKSGNTDAAPEMIQVIYKDLSVPALPRALAAQVNQGDVRLTWNSNAENDLHGYNIYQVTENSPVKINEEIVNEPQYTAAGLEDGDYIYAVSAVDNFGNESALSEAVSAHVYTPTIYVPSELVSSPHLDFDGDAARNSSVAISDNGNPVSTFTCDSEGFYSGEITLSPGGNELTAQATDNRGNISKKSIPVVVVFDEPPPSPTGLAAAVSGQDCLLTWDKVIVNDLSGYILYRNGERVNPVPITDTAYNDANLPDGLYEYQVSSIDTYGLESPLSPIVPARIGDAQPPLPPQGLTAMVLDMEIRLSWSPNTEPDLAGYVVYKNTADGWRSLNSEPLATTEFTDTVMANGAYQYRVTAVDQLGNESQPSDALTATVASGVQPHPAIKNITVSPEGHAVYVCWEFEEWPASSFKLYRSLTPEGPYALINAHPSSDSCYVDQDVTPGQRYYYKVVAVDEYGFESASSDPGQVLPENRLSCAKPVILKPTTSEEPLVVTESAVDISGASKPGAMVDLYQNEKYIGATRAVENLTPTTFLIAPDANSRIGDIAVSPTGRKAAYLQDDMYSSSWGYELKILNLKNNVVNTVADQVTSFRWSPKEDHIAYTAYQSKDGALIEQIFIYDITAEISRALIEETQTSQCFPSWSADGNQIIFVMQDGNGIADIWIKNNQNHTQSRLTQNTENSPFPYVPSFSPDARYAAYIDSTTGDLYILDLAGNESLRAATSVNYSDAARSWYEWSPTANQIAFTKYTDGTDIFVYDVETQTTHRAARSTHFMNGLQWSDDGLYIIYAETINSHPQSKINIAPADIPDGDKTLLELDFDPLCLSTRPSSAVWYGKWQGSDFILYQWFPGRFAFNGVNLTGGENKFYALCIDDDTGKISPWSDIVTIYVDEGTLPDPAISSDGIYYYPGAPVSGDKIAGTITVQNNGAVSVEDVDIGIYIIDQQNNRQLISSGTIAGIGPSSSENYYFSWDPSGKTGLYQISALVDPSNRLLESSETNNRAEKEILISGTAGLSMTTRLDSDCYPSDSDIRINTQVGNSGTEKSGWLNVQVIDIAGNSVAVIATDHLVMPYAFNQGFTFNWNTGDSYAGQYVVKAVLTPEDGSATIENTAPFTITPDVAVLTQVTTDKRRYGPGEEVLLTVFTKNNSQNAWLNSIPALLRIIDANANTVFVQERELGTLFPQNSETWSLTWNTGLSTPGIYKAEAEIHLYGQTMATASKQFEISATPHVTGDLTLASGIITPGSMVTAGYAIHNGGNIAIDNLTLQVALLDQETSRTTVIAESVADHIGVNDTITGSQELSTGGLAVKQYMLLLQVRINEEWATLASRPLVISDAAAPIVTILSPENQGVYYSKFGLTVEAKDRDTGVSHVEYRMDDGQWVGLPLTDPSQARYSISYTPSGGSVGEHVFSFRAGDTQGNTSPAVSATVHIAPKMEIAASINENQFGMNADIPIHITVKNTGWTKTAVVGTVIENKTTNEITETLDPIQTTVSNDETRDLTRTWNTGAHPPGDYQARINIACNGQTLSEVLIPFAIMPVLKIDLAIETDKPSYGMNETLHGMIRAINSGNYQVPLTTVHAAIHNEVSTTPYFTNDFQIPYLSCGQTATSAVDWNIGVSTAGNYQMIATASVGGLEVNQQVAGFTVTPVFAVSGALTATPENVACGMPVYANGSVTNNGNIPLAKLTAQLAVIDPDNHTEIRTYENTLDISIGETRPATFTIDTNGLSLKQYIAELRYLLNGNLRVLAGAAFSITDATPPVIAILTPAENSVLNGAFNVAASAVDDDSGIDRVEYQFGAGQWQPLLPDGSANIYTASYTPTEADNGERVIFCRAFDKAGNASENVFVHVRIQLSDAFALLTGTLAASFDKVMQGMNETFTYTIANPAADDVKDIRIRIPIIHKDSGRTVKTLEQTATIAAQSIFTANIADLVDLEPGIYNATLSVARSSPVAEKSLCSDEFTVVAKPDISLEKTTSADIRLLVWINDNCRLTQNRSLPSSNGSDQGYAFKDCIRTDLLEQILKDNVSDYHMVFDPQEFEKELRNPYYTDFLILGDQHQLEDHACFELIEKINSGACVVSSKWISQQFALKYNSIFGLKFVGKISGDPSVKTVDSPITKAGTIASVGPSVRVEPCTNSVMIAGKFVTDKKNKQASPAIVLNTFGKGKAVYFAFDIGMMLIDDKFQWMSKLMADTFTYIKSQSVPLPAYPFQVVPAGVKIELPGADYLVKIIETFPEALFLYDPHNRQWTNSSPHQSDVILDLDGRSTCWCYYLAPDSVGVYPTETQAGILFNDEFVNLQTMPLDIPVPKDRTGCIRNAISQIDLLKVDIWDLIHKMNANLTLKLVLATPYPPETDDCVHDILRTYGVADLLSPYGSYCAARRTFYSNIMYGNITDLIYAIREVMQIRSADTSEIRYILDTLLKIEEGRYYLYNLDQ